MSLEPAETQSGTLLSNSSMRLTPIEFTYRTEKSHGITQFAISRLLEANDREMRCTREREQMRYDWRLNTAIRRNKNCILFSK
jgi:hypothetical protein